MSTEHRECVNVLGVRVHALDIDAAATACEGLIARHGHGYVSVTGVHGVMEAQADTEFLKILNRSFISVPDGMPLVWVGRLQGHRNISRVYGPDFMIEMCRRSVQHGYRHFLFGGKEGIAAELAVNLQKRFPRLKIVGTYTPPFRALNAEEERELRCIIGRSRPDIVWVGLSTPKQERFMARYLERLDTHLMVGVGAAFDVHTGHIKDAPDWMKSCGVQWLHRLLQEPRRLTRRYLMNNPRFMCRIALQLSGINKYTL